MVKNEIPNAAMNIDSVICNIGTKCSGRILINGKELHDTGKMQEQEMQKQRELYRTPDHSVPNKSK